MKISIFKGYADTNPNDISLDEIVNIIRTDDSVKNRTEKHRYFLSQGLKKDAEREKANTGTFSVAARFKGGKSVEHIVELSGLAFGDFDKVAPERLQELLQRLKNDPHTVLAFVTHSQAGLRIVYPYRISGWESMDISQQCQAYLDAFETGMGYYEQLLGIPSDSHCKDCTRVSNLVHDPNVYYNPDAVPFTVVAKDSPKDVRKPKKARRVSLLPAVRAAKAELEEQGILFEKGHHNDYVSRMGYLLNAFGVDFTKARDWALEEFGEDYHDNIGRIFESCYRKTEEHGSRKLPKKPAEKSKWASVKAIEQFLSTQADLRYNVIRRQCEIAWKDRSPAGHFEPITDRDENTLWCRMQKTGVEVRLPDIRNVIQSEFIPKFHPFEVYFSELPEWDGKTDYIGQLARTVHVAGDQERFGEYFLKWMVAMVGGILDEEVVNHQILVFTGRQGNYKSTFFALLLPPELQPYYQVKMNNSHLNKDDMLTMSERALICLEEIDEQRPSDLNQLKAMVTARTVSERAAYARNKEVRPHIASFCGTGNNPNFLTDPTDNRRWIVVQVEDIDSPYDHPFNYTGIYSQAYALWKSGFRYWLDQEEILELNLQNKEFEVPNLEEELVLTYFRQPFKGCKGVFMKVSEILERINAGTRQVLSPTKLGILMKKLGFLPVKYKRERGYIVVERSIDEIQASRKIIGEELLDLQEGDTL